MSKLTKTITLFLAFVLIGLTACHKERKNASISTDVQQFEAVWNELNDTYVFWSIDTTDWDAVYIKYHPLFEAMKNEPDSVWKSTWRELSSTLIDHHLKITLARPSTNDTIELTPGQDEAEKRDYYHYRKLWHESQLNKLVECGRLVDTISSPFKETIKVKETIKEITITRFFYSGILDQKIAYLYIPTFSELSLDTIGAFGHFMQLVAMGNIKAAIIDVRDNPGGDAKNLVPMLSCFTTEPILIGYTQTKLGLGKFDLSAKMPWIIHPSSVSRQREIPIIVLADVNSVSMGEVGPIALKHLPNCYVVGERTFGATGPIVERKGNGYTITAAQTLFEDVDGTIYEGHGTEPDIECLFDQTLWNSGIDNQLEMAISVALDKILENGN